MSAVLSATTTTFTATPAHCSTKHAYYRPYRMRIPRPTNIKPIGS